MFKTWHKIVGGLVVVSALYNAATYDPEREAAKGAVLHAAHAAREVAATCGDVVELLPRVVQAHGYRCPVVTSCRIGQAGVVDASRQVRFSCGSYAFAVTDDHGRWVLSTR